MSYQSQETVREFVEETREHLAALEPDLLAMERQKDYVDSAVVHRVFRAIHSTKGGASFLAFKSLNRVAHRMESVLDLVRSGRLAIGPELVDVLLRSVDVIRAMVDDIENCDSVPCDREVGELEALLRREGSGAREADAESAVGAPA